MLEVDRGGRQVLRDGCEKVRLKTTAVGHGDDERSNRRAGREGSIWLITVWW